MTFGNKIKKYKTVLIFIILVIFGGVFLYNYLSPSISYSGGYTPEGEYCDYGYNQATQACCDEDDYSCEVCDSYGIYCDESGFQYGFYDIEHISKKTPDGDYDCSEFNNWEEAQKVFIREGGPQKDPYELDRDGDGIACELLKD